MTTATAPKTLSAVELVQQALADIATAQLASGDAYAARNAAEAAIRAAKRERTEAERAVVLKERGAEKREAACVEKLAQHTSELARADRLVAVAAEVIEQRRSALRMIRREHFRELAAEAETVTQAASIAAEKVLAALAEYDEAHARAVAAWRPLAPAVQDYIREQDRRKPVPEDRGQEAVWADARIPPSPVTPELVIAFRAPVHPRIFN